MAKDFVRSKDNVKNIITEKIDHTEVNDLLHDGENSYIHTPKHEFHNLIDNVKNVNISDSSYISSNKNGNNVTISTYKLTTKINNIDKKDIDQDSEILLIKEKLENNNTENIDPLEEFFGKKLNITGIGQFKYVKARYKMIKNMNDIKNIIIYMSGISTSVKPFFIGSEDPNEDMVRISEQSSFEISIPEIDNHNFYIPTLETDNKGLSKLNVFSPESVNKMKLVSLRGIDSEFLTFTLEKKAEQN